jgi:cysteinyl-tRNA synthetase
MKAVMEWAKHEGKQNDISAELRRIVETAELTDVQVNQKIAEMEAARRSRNFAVSDAVRAELNAAGILVENTKDAVRWRRK